jgi:DNA-binding CsgD family transcriptional regulator
VAAAAVPGSAAGDRRSRSHAGVVHSRSITTSQLAGQTLSLACRASDNRRGEVEADVSSRGRAPLGAAGDMTTVAPVEVVGRQAELERIGGFLDPPGGGLGLLLEGVPGIGKTTLWRAGIELGRARGYRVLWCRPAASETAYSFAALGDLLSPVVDEVLARLPAPQRAAMGAALALAENDGPEADERVVGLAVLSLLRLLAVRDPVLVGVDDVQWLDPASAAVLGFAARRLQDEPLKLLLSVRVEPGAVPLQVERELADRLLRVRVGPLSSSDLHRIVVARFGRPLPRPTLLGVHHTAGGNPFYALEITRFLLEQAKPPGPGDPLPVPPTLEELLRARVARLPLAAREALEAAALLSEPTLQALEGTGADPAWLDLAVAAGVAELVDDRVRFTHPLLAAAVSSTIGPGRRRRLHGRLAELELDPEERARHLALAITGPDGVVADALEGAAQHAVLRGAAASAAQLAELAAQRTPPEDREGHWRRLIEAGLRHATSGDFARARVLLAPLLEELPPGPLRGKVLLNLADIGWDDNRERISLAKRALVEVDDDVSRARLHSLLAAIDMFNLPGALAHLQAALEAAERAGNQELTVLALVSRIDTEIAAGQMTPGLLARALALAEATGGRLLPRVPHFESPAQVLGMALLRLDRLDQARAILETARADGLAQGAYPAVGFTCAVLTWVTWRLGDWPAAARYAAEFSELFEQLGLERLSPWPLYATALVDAHLGHVEQARAAATRGVALALEVEGEDGGWVMQNRGVLGFLELSLGNPAAAVDLLRPGARFLHRAGWRDPFGDLKHNAIEALILVGELEEAAESLADLEDWSHSVDAPAVAATARRCRGLLRAAQGDHDGALEALTEAARAFQQVPVPFERGRTLLALGALQRRAKDRGAAQASLGAALAGFQQLGARLWADQARAQLAQLGGRPPQDGKLTPTETQIAALVAKGRTNQQVADALFVSPKTVEWNLSKVYRKLHVRSRAELAAKLARRAQG